jgi:hypothetical protein
VPFGPNDRIVEPGRPGGVDDIAVFEIVVGMVVCDEDVADVGQLHARVDDAARRAVAAVDDEGNAVDEQQVRRIVARPADTRPALRADEDELARARGRLRRRDLRRGGAGERGKQRQSERAAIEHGVPPVTRIVFRMRLVSGDGGVEASA